MDEPTTDRPHRATALRTRLGRSVAQGPGGDAGREHSHDPKRDWLRDVILGGQDGLVNILGIILGVVAGGGSRTVLITAGFAAAITESISMGAVGYTSTTEDRDYYAAQQRTEESAVENDQDLECREIEALYREKGFSGDLLDQVVATITANRDRWVGTILSEERHLQPVEDSDVLRSSAVITLATLIGHLIPLLPFVFVSRHVAFIVAIAMSAAVLFGVGAYTALTRVGSWWKSGIRMIAIGLGAAAVGFGVGHLFNAKGI
jgi:VIT1/CCC1 family predicted Fe2+/Mn2+ transporter